MLLLGENLSLRIETEIEPEIKSANLPELHRQSQLPLGHATSVAILPKALELRPVCVK